MYKKYTYYEKLENQKIRNNIKKKIKNQKIRKNIKKIKSKIRKIFKLFYSHTLS